MDATIKAFATEMEEQLAANEHKGGWEDSSPEFLLTELEHHLYMLKRRIEGIAQPLFERGKTADEVVGVHSVIRDETADIANFAMMIADVCGALREE